MGEAKFVNVEGIRTCYFEGGRGEPMVLVHGGHFGMTTSARGFMPIFSNLAAHFHVYAVDKLGMGLTDSPRDDSDYSMQAIVEHLYRFVETLGLESVHLVGHSRGGLPVARIAMDHPDKVKTLTIFDSNTLSPGDPKPSEPNLRPAGPPPTKDSVRQKLLKSGSSVRKDYVTEEYVEAELEVASHPKIRQTAEKLEKLRKLFVELNPDKVHVRPALENNSGTAWWLYEVKDETLDRLRAGRLKRPTLIIWGYNDPSATYDMGMNLFKLVSSSVDQAQLHFLNKCGHAPYREYPHEVTELMLSFVGGITTRPVG
jgi:2-hydroxy-6-oxo-6-(2'-carboxyphenyl)-hexa-2,4-dienoate hydrolase